MVVLATGGLGIEPAGYLHVSLASGALDGPKIFFGVVCPD